MIRLHFPASRMQEYVEVPFEVPEGTRSLRVSYRVQPGAVVDLGCLDPERFRGWSGGARSCFELGIETATPGYLPGPLLAGRWNVLLGLYRLPSEGAWVELEVEPSPRELPDLPTSSVLAPRAELPRPEGWVRGDLHCHTHHSDARGSLSDLVSMARARGLDFLAVTDHNVVSHHAEMASRDWGIHLLPGMEVTTYRGHFNVLGPVGWVDFRFADDAGARRALRDAGERGALRVLNHPKPTGCDWEYGVWDDFDLFEVWNGPWPTRNEVSLARWHALLCEGRRIPAVGGSDRHQPPLPDPDPPSLQVGSPTVWIPGPVEALTDRLRAGRCCISEGRTGPVVWIEGPSGLVMGGTAEVGDPLTVHVWGAPDGQVRLVTDLGELPPARELAMPDARFLRVEVVGEEGVRALSNPVYRSSR